MSTNRFPAGLLHNTATGRWHPIPFRYAPRPSEHGESHGRFRSIGNHVEGFATREEADAYIAERVAQDVNPWEATGLVWEWDGTGVPAMTWAFKAPTAETA